MIGPIYPNDRVVAIEADTPPAMHVFGPGHAYQPKALGHLVQREDSLHPSQISLFKCATVLLIKIVLRERQIRCNLSKIINQFVIKFSTIYDCP